MTCHEIEVIGAKPLTFDFKSNLTENTVIDSNVVHDINDIDVSNHLKTSPEWQGKEPQTHDLSLVRQCMASTAEGHISACTKHARQG